MGMFFVFVSFYCLHYTHIFYFFAVKIQNRDTHGWNQVFRFFVCLFVLIKMFIAAITESYTNIVVFYEIIIFFVFFEIKEKKDKEKNHKLTWNIHLAIIGDF